jgi:hypothetical protein
MIALIGAFMKEVENEKIAQNQGYQTRTNQHW